MFCISSIFCSIRQSPSPIYNYVYTVVLQLKALVSASSATLSPKLLIVAHTQVGLGYWDCFGMKWEGSTNGNTLLECYDLPNLHF